VFLTEDVSKGDDVFLNAAKRLRPMPKTWLATSGAAALRAMVARITWAVLRKRRS
jgi:hypothetical protein